MVGAVEDAPLEPPHALVTAGESLHWMEWEIVLPQLAEVVSATILEDDWEGPPAVRKRIRPVLMRSTIMRVWQGVDLLTELQDRALFTPAGMRRFGPGVWEPNCGGAPGASALAARLCSARNG